MAAAIEQLDEVAEILKRRHQPKTACPCTARCAGRARPGSVGWARPRTPPESLTRDRPRRHQARACGLLAGINEHCDRRKVRIAQSLVDGFGEDRAEEGRAA